MFSQTEKHHIAAAVEELLLSMQHPEMPTTKPMFELRVFGKENWSWASIKPNHIFSAENPPNVNHWNEVARQVL